MDKLVENGRSAWRAVLGKCRLSSKLSETTSSGSAREWKAVAGY